MAGALRGIPAVMVAEEWAGSFAGALCSAEETSSARYCPWFVSYFFLVCRNFFVASDGV
jgi:hypothetical protein